jgi:LPXTG-motif cell wall-anchored protein
MSANMSANESQNTFSRLAQQYWAPIALVALAAVFIGQNRDRQQVRFLWLTVESPMWLLLAAMLLVGVAVGLLLRRRRP